MTNDKAHAVATKLGQRCGMPGERYQPGDQVFSLATESTATVMHMHGANCVARNAAGGVEVLAYYEIGRPLTPAAAHV